MSGPAERKAQGPISILFVPVELEAEWWS
jgi:hypothetical protein